MKDLLRFCTSGSVDDGKSTLLGRLLYETGRIYDDQLEATKKASEKRGKKDIDLSLLLDGLESEREQSITIDVAYRYFETDKRRFIVADTPGHVEYTRNMVTGASNSSLAMILIDAENGVTEQTKRHAFINSLLNISHVIVVINKMDLVEWSEEIYNKIHDDFMHFSKILNFKEKFIVPISALTGDGVCNKSNNMSWYKGRTVLDILESVQVNTERNYIDFRFPVQNVIRPNSNFRGYAGRISSGTIRQGEEVIILPSKLKTRITNIILSGELTKKADVGDSVILNLKHDIDISRGDMIVRKGNAPLISNKFISTICWMNENGLANKIYILKTGTRKVNSFIIVQHKIDVNTLHRIENDNVKLNDIFKASVETTQPVFFDPYIQNRETGSFILIDPETNNTVACGMIKSTEEIDDGEKILKGGVTADYKGEKASVYWFTGLSGSGKSTLAYQYSKILQNLNHKVIILDGDNIRKGLCNDLEFSLKDRKENLRRVAEVAKLLSDNGIIVITAFITPTIKDRKQAKDIIGGQYKEIFVKCPLEKCEERDVKGLYKKAREGTIKQFTGISSPYEIPNNSDIIINTEIKTIEESISELIDWDNR